MMRRTRERRYTAAEAANLLQRQTAFGDVDSDDDAPFGDFGGDAPQAEVYYPPASDSESECDTEDLPETSQPESTTTETSKDGTIWSSMQPGAGRGRVPMRNIFAARPGPTAFAKVRIHDELSSFLCMFDPNILETVRDCTVKFARSDGQNQDWDLSVTELKAFISVFFIRALTTCGYPLNQLWANEWGNEMVKETMSRDRFKSIMRYLRFDDKNTRLARKEADKFAAITDIWNQFTDNCKSCYVPGVNITVDEQLFPSKARCGFTQYMANKPDKFGIKFWIAADLDSKYFLNGFPYLGKGQYRSSDGVPLSQDVVQRLVEPFLDKGRNITMDNFFTSMKLGQSLRARNTTILGTVNRQRRELPPCVRGKERLFHTQLMKSNDATLTIYQSKPNKNVCILSTMHRSIGIGTDPKEKPESVTDYNHTKWGVDILDQMARNYSVRVGTSRWPVAVFYNMLDLAAINAYVLFKQCLDKPQLTRREFLQDLALQLRKEHMDEKDSASVPPRTPRRQQRSALQPLPTTPQNQPTTPRAAKRAQNGPQTPDTPTPKKRRQCQLDGCGNKTLISCHKCDKRACGTCTGTFTMTCVKCI